eukprot:CAMPEP_0113306524 /NCGR_PEP_ID=MMETSP0010_2-20120614/5739_1 /TAXON_ID=216773 ORGANISM="Corethron hystrix, Strain 308" /NCGR_SAMPLE_ID=MMETSP0010_2 /ASSEMBLY_ACC=CAM_ASM_000155 /LENGTH=153 /DNA_ID=CAMNT_0000161205 /DNA_START=113 /DNA_END=574 /DNA_ORIENTATION=+ /assembly_acc=CAM_ASM_000155
MNATFRAAREQFRQKVDLTHTQEVARLYRKSLKVTLSWCIDREIFNEEATNLRARFEAQRDANPAAAARILREGQEELFEMSHPDPYCVPHMPGGSLFMRNPPPPLEVCFPDGNYPADAPKITINPDFSECKVETGKSATGQVVVDFYTKNMT